MVVEGGGTNLAMSLIVESKRIASEGKGKCLSQRTLGFDPDLDYCDRLR